ncbi:C-reactive protein-like [Heterodontus francisci]|uniref:C-reactive protein-like n=1 Tax=Heterodontus francisci TaxID=7792 RepID=UPI00355B0BAB
MRDFIAFLLVICIYLPVTAGAGLAGQSVIFPTETADSYVKLLPSNFSDLSAFTLCMRLASEKTQDYALFSYAVPNSDNELSLWLEDGKLALYLGSTGVLFDLAAPTALLRHMCVSWESCSGLITFWLDGVRSLRKGGKRDGLVRGGGVTILGQDQDSLGGRFELKQSFVGEVTDVNLWSHVLSASAIRAISQGCYAAGGDVIDWAAIRHQSDGTVTIEDNRDCIV